MPQLSQDQTARTFLGKCSSAYEAIAAQILKLSRKHESERLLEWVELAAQFSWMAHPGRYADGRLENPAFQIGTRLETHLPTSPLATRATSHEKLTIDRRRVLHVATTVYDTGGHSRLIKNWIENDEGSTHSLVLILQGNLSVPDWLSEAVQKSAGILTVLSAQLSHLQRASSLRELAQECADTVILHIHPDDVVPIVAFADPGLPPVGLMNHADHVFWLGASVADLVIDMRSFGVELTKARRFPKQSALLPLPLKFKASSVSREEARRRLKLTDADVALLSIGSSYKYKPTGAHNFYETVDEILDRNPTARLFVVGVEPEEAREQSGKVPHERVHFLGTIADPICYQAAADLYLEGFPYGSLTALLETVALGVCPVVMFDPPMPHVNNAASVGGGDLMSKGSRDEYIEHVTSLIKDGDERARVATQTRAFVISTHSSETWNTRIQEIYRYLDSIQHQPGPIPESDFQATATDLGLASFSYSHIGDSSTLLRFANEHFDKLSRQDVMSLFQAALRSGDSKLAFAPLRNWLGLWKTKMFGA